MDDPDATHSKSVENYFGNLDRYISTSGPQGFEKVTDDLVLKYGKDFVTNDNNYEWRSKENRQSAAYLKEMQDWFDERQDALRKKGCSNAEIAAITTMNRILRVVNQCRSNHGDHFPQKKSFETLLIQLKMRKR
ncbi:uncharacterized protein [Clytia hemisphaerica]|uniref:uncharacterized protein n=1 Tax=Clytia hemisphaerica TaxID=252671 RepID=UPI0034D3BB58